MIFSKNCVLILLLSCSGLSKACLDPVGQNLLESIQSRANDIKANHLKLYPEPLLLRTVDENALIAYFYASDSKTQELLTTYCQEAADICNEATYTYCNQTDSLFSQELKNTLKLSKDSGF